VEKRKLRVFQLSMLLMNSHQRLHRSKPPISGRPKRPHQQVKKIFGAHISAIQHGRKELGKKLSDFARRCFGQGLVVSMFD
jgi:hypothetical protein